MDQKPAYPTEANIEEVLAEFGGDYRLAIAALLHDLAELAADYDSAVSRGYVRATIPLHTHLRKPA